MFTDFRFRALSTQSEISVNVLRIYYVLVDILEVMKCFRTMLEVRYLVV